MRITKHIFKKKKKKKLIVASRKEIYISSRYSQNEKLIFKFNWLLRRAPGPKLGVKSQRTYYHIRMAISSLGAICWHVTDKKIQYMFECFETNILQKVDYDVQLKILWLVKELEKWRGVLQSRNINPILFWRDSISIINGIWSKKWRYAKCNLYLDQHLGTRSTMESLVH